MNAARLLYPVKTLGPGNRVGIWLCGCPRRCRGCSNPELWTRKDEYEISAGDLLGLVRNLADEHPVDGFTITGGEPLDQAGELSALMDGLGEISLDILVYTGYTMEELLSDPDGKKMECVRKAAVVVDGPYVDTLNTGRKMAGSSNQRVFVVNHRFDGLYREYLEDGTPEVQNFVGDRGAYSIGIHRSDFADGLLGALEKERSGEGHA